MRNKQIACYVPRLRFFHEKEKKEEEEAKKSNVWGQEKINIQIRGERKRYRFFFILYTDIVLCQLSEVWLSRTVRKIVCQRKYINSCSVHMNWQIRKSSFVFRFYSQSLVEENRKKVNLSWILSKKHVYFA